MDHFCYYRPKQQPQARYSVSSMARNACTEDKIPIKTIHVGNLPSEITEKDVKEYFSGFGSVASLAIKRSGSERALWIYAFVTFEKTESATKALGLSKHEILNRRVVVKAGNSWNQPKAKDAKCEGNTFSLLDLNDDCLFHIASHLELRDFFNLSKTCKRLECGLEPIFASYKKLDVYSLEGLTLMEIHEILYKIGPHVQHLVCRSLTLIGERLAFLELRKQYHSPGNLRPLQHYKRNVACMSKNIICSLSKSLIESFKNLKTLKCNITDDMSALLSNCENLQNLDLCESLDFTGKYLDKISNLQNLNLDGCDNLQPEFFKNLCMKTKLVSINIERCGGGRLDRSSFETLASTQTKLESLSISTYYGASNLSPLATLKNLKRLQIFCYTDNCDEFLEELAKHRGAELEVLVLLYSCFNQKVEQAICSLKNLKVLAVHWCKNITSKFFTQLALTSLECLVIKLSEVTVDVEKDILNLIRKSETIKVIALATNHHLDKRRLVLSAYEIIEKKERKYPFSLFTSGPCVMDGIFHEKGDFRSLREYSKTIKKLGYLGPLPEWFNFHVYVFE